MTPGLWVLLAALSLGLLTFALTAAPPWNEGLHLVAAQLIRAGKRPYLDFFYQHPPLYTYLNAAWMGVFGDSWRSAQSLPALLIAGCVVLVASYAHSRLDQSEWRTAGAAAAALLVGLHAPVIRYGAIAQPYAFCLFLLVLAFRLVTGAVGREKSWLAVWGGLCAGSAASSSLLAGPAAPILFFWMLRHNRAGSSWCKAAAFLAGVTIAFLPLLSLAVRAPRQVWFDVFGYHLLYRRPENLPWQYLKHDFKVITGWLDSPQALLLAGLAGAALRHITGARQLPQQRAEYRLCVWLTCGLAVIAAVASPTFAGYFVLMIPFLGLLAAVGFYAAGTAWWAPRRPAWMVVFLAAILAAGVAKWFFQHRAIFSFSWRRYERIAETVNQITPPDGLVYAIPEIYFAARRVPPPGLENLFSSYLPPAVAAAQKLVPASLIEQWLSAGRFDTVLMADPAKADALGLPRLYAKRDRIDGFDIFWRRIQGSPSEPRP